jgi:hypothetical protein
MEALRAKQSLSFSATAAAVAPLIMDSKTRKPTTIEKQGAWERNTKRGRADETCRKGTHL